MTVPPDDTTTDLHAIIAALRTERDAALSEKVALAEELATRTAELDARKSEYAERIEYQAAIDVLKAMSASPGDAQPVFELIATRARDICGSYGVSVLEFDGSLIHLRAWNGVSDNAKVREAYVARFPCAPTRKSPEGRAILNSHVVHIKDYLSEPDVEHTPGTTIRSSVTVPIIRGGNVVGILDMGSHEAAGFSDAQVQLLKTFAEQAVIAITSAETYRALQTRTSDLQETLEYQTAISDVLKVISRSTFDLQPVLDTVAETAARLCDADQAAIFQREGGLIRFVTNVGFPPEYEAHLKGLGTCAFDPYPQNVTTRAIREGRPVHINDVVLIAGYAEQAITLGKQRTSLGVPLLREGEAIGVIVVARQRVEPFTGRQIELVSTFADQAVIAIENTRLMTEQREALEQQTATAEVLQVINASPGNLAPVFDTILENAHRLCGATLGSITTYDGEYFRAEAIRGYPEQYAAWMRRGFQAGPQSAQQALIDGERVVHVPDLRATGPWHDYEFQRAFIEATGVRAFLAVPLHRDGKLFGYIGAHRKEARAFTEKEITLLENFAAQAVIAMENARLLSEQQEALEQQTATAEMLAVINASPGDLTPVFDAMLEKATRLCEAAFGELWVGADSVRPTALFGVPAAYAEFRANYNYLSEPGSFGALLREGHPLIHVVDLSESEGYRNGDPGRRAMVDLGGARSAVAIPLIADGIRRGAIVIYRQEVRPFTEEQIALLQNFAAQAVIAMENARLLKEQREALEQQTATAEVLQVINASAGDLMPVFDTILAKALRLCEAAFGALVTYDGKYFQIVATQGFSPELAKASLERGPLLPSKSFAYEQIVHGADIVHIPDIMALGVPFPSSPNIDHDGARTTLFVALRGEDALFGAFVIFRKEVRLFSDKQIALLKNFAAQAVIAMENARLLDAIRRRQEELHITFENMGDGVALFDETRHLVASNRRFQDMLDVPDDVISARPTFADYIRYLANRGEYGPDPEDHVQHLLAPGSQPAAFERTRPNGRIIEVRSNPVPSGGFVVIYSDITERKRHEEEIRAARDAAEDASRTIEAAYRDLKAAQANLIQAEKMASLGQLTAGIAHEIKNPLNFVNNFAELSGDLLDELNDAVAGNRQAEIDELRATLQGNLAKITEHGRRADAIVRSMLEHSRGSSGERRMVDLNALINEALNLAYHGARAQDQSFNITLERDFAKGIAPIELAPQDMTRMFLNLFSNGFYVTTQQARKGADAGFVATLRVTTRDAGEAVEVRVRDNGVGVSAEMKDKLFQPFFTTKPTGAGTGLGLSISYDIIVKQHGGRVTVDSRLGKYTEFVVTLPR
jgi:GAF domain-containing protein/signal transduction histidine kinase